MRVCVSVAYVYTVVLSILSYTKGKAAPAAAAGVKGFTLEEVAKHVTEDDCWVVVNGQVCGATDCGAIYLAVHHNPAIILRDVVWCITAILRRRAL